MRGKDRERAGISHKIVEISAVVWRVLKCLPMADVRGLQKEPEKQATFAGPHPPELLGDCSDQS